MKVKRLIKKLQDFDEEAIVITYSTNAHLRGQYLSSHDIKDVELCKDGKMVGVVHGSS